VLRFILNNEDITTELPAGTTVLDFVRYHQNLKGTKIGCREGDCGACTILVGELVDDGKLRYRSMTSCLMPLANAAGKHIVTVEGINPEDGSLTPVQQAMVDESGTQCGFCTVGFVMSLTGFCLENVGSPHVSKSSISAATSAIDGNICRCTGYKSIERAAAKVCERLAASREQRVPAYFVDIPARLREINATTAQAETRAVASVPLYIGGGTDVYVQTPEQMAETTATSLFYDPALRSIEDAGEYIELGASVTVTDLLESPVMQTIFPHLYKHLKLVSSTPIRNMATLAGNFVNASPIGDMTIWFLSLDAEIVLTAEGGMQNAESPGAAAGPYEYATGGDANVRTGSSSDRVLPLRDFYLGYKQLAKSDDEYISKIRFRKPTGYFRFNFEKVSKRTYLDIASVNTAISLRVSSPTVRESARITVGALPHGRATDTFILDAHVSTGGVAPVPLYLKGTSVFLRGKPVTAETISHANEIIQTEISPISDVRGSAEYKRLLLRQLFTAHFVELFAERI